MTQQSNLSLTNMTSFTDNVTDVTADSNANASSMTSFSLTRTTSPPPGCLVIPFVPGAMPWENPADLVTPDVGQMVSDVVVCGLLTIAFCVGSPANVINMVVFCKQGLKERINLCLFSLSLADFLVITLHFVWSLDWVERKLTGIDTSRPIMEVFINNYIIGLAGFIYVSSFLSAVIAMERCFCVVSPFRSQSILQTRTMAAIIAVATVVIVGCLFLVSAKWRVVCIFDPISGQTLQALSNSQYYHNHKDLVQVVEGVVYGVAIPGLCLTAVTVATVITVVRLRAMARWRGKATSANDSAALTPKDVALTRMLVGVSVLFIVCTIPGLLFKTSILFLPDLSLSGKYYNTYLVLVNIQQAFIYINSSVNFIIYFTAGTKYRNTLKRMFSKSAAAADSRQQATKESNAKDTSVNSVSAGMADVVVLVSHIPTNVK